MKVLITGTSQGIGKAIAELFLNKGHMVIGIDRQASAFTDESMLISSATSGIMRIFLK